ncbi:MAG: RICIN domain-containing protein, partial [Bryobacterales bacterium]|nr:RICIN domain-containing protein [Bryobacterales bacterium]
DTNVWRTLPAMATPRGYHMTALLMRDGRVLVGGGGLCGCVADHQNAQIYSPGYLFNADGSAAARPTISSAPAAVNAGQTFALAGSDNITRFTMVRLQGTTHGLDSDQRYLPVASSKTGAGQYSLTLASNVNILMPGLYWVFGLNAAGVPSVGYPVHVHASGAAVMTNLAKGKTATQSSTYNTQAAARAVDGNQSGDNGLNSVSHTNSDGQAYWQVDLGSAANLSEVVLWNRTDCCADRLANFHVLVSDTPFTGASLAQAQGVPGVTDLRFAGVMGQTGRFALNRTGRYVRVQLEGTNFLQLAEVEVFGTAVANRAPAVALTSPTSGARFNAPASIAINADASDADGNLARVEFYNGSTLLGSDTAAPFTHTWTGVAAGSYTITARAFDAAGLNASASASVTVNPGTAVNTAPTVSIASPANNASFAAPASIAINANASDADGNLARVEFYNGSTLLGTDTAAPFTYTWANVAAGSYTVTARAFGTAGLNASASVAITVTSGVVTSTIVNPGSGKCIDINGGSAAANAAAILYTCHGGVNQNFQFRPIAGQTGVYNIVAAHSNLCLTAQNGGTADNTAIVQTACGTSNNQRFNVARQSNGTYRITPRIATSKALRLRNGATANLTPIVIFTWFNYGSQQFRINGLQ